MANMEASNHLELKVLDLLLRNTAYTPPATVYLALFTALSADGDTVTEVAGGSGYSRQAIAFSAASARATSNSAAVAFASATGSWGTATHFGLYDASSGGNLLFWGALSGSLVISSGTAVSFDAGAVDVSLSDALSTAIANALLDHILRNAAWTSIPNRYVRLYTAWTNESTHTEVADAGYAAQAATFAAASAGQSASSAAIAHGAAVGSYTVTDVALWTAASGGTLIAHHTLASSLAVTPGKNPTWNTGGLKVSLD